MLARERHFERPDVSDRSLRCSQYHASAGTMRERLVFTSSIQESGPRRSDEKLWIA